MTEQIVELAENLNVGNLMLLLQFGNMNKDLTRYNTRLFAEKVMPKLRNLWPEWNNHDDRFWAHPMQKRVPLKVAAE